MTRRPGGGDGPFTRCPTALSVEPVPTVLIDCSRQLFHLADRSSELAERVEQDDGDGGVLDTHRLRFLARNLAVDVVVVRGQVTRMVVRVTPSGPIDVVAVTPRRTFTLNSRVGVVVANVTRGPTSVRLIMDGPDGRRRVHTDWFLA